MLKSGIHSLIKKNEDKFKKSLIDVLSFKLNENIEYLNIQTQKKLLQSTYKETNFNEELKNFIEFLESFDPNKPAKVKLKNDSLINITENELNEIKGLFDQLNPENRKKMVETIFESKANLDQHLEFYRKTKALK